VKEAIMAKEGPTFIDMHIEKVVLGIALVILGYCALTWGIDTPRRVTVGKDAKGKLVQVKPARVDLEILNRAEMLKELVLAQKPPKFLLKNWSDQLRAWQADPLRVTRWECVKDKVTGEMVTKAAGTRRVTLASANMAGPYAVGLLRTKRMAVKRTTPAALRAVMPKPSTPQGVCARVRTLITKGDPKKPTEHLEESNRWTTAAFYDFAKLDTLWRKVTDNTVADTTRPIPYGFEVQYQRRAIGGPWVDAPSMKPIYPTYYNADGTVSKTEVPTVPEYTGDNDSAVLNAIDLHLRQGWAGWLMQPDADRVFAGGEKKDWKEVFFPWKTMENYPPKASETPKVGTPKAPGVPKAPGAGRAGVPARIAYGEVPAGRDASESINDPQKLPDFSTQLTRKRLLMWAHQTNLDFETEYRVRYRMVMFSPLLTVDDAVEEPEMAKVQLLKSPWSDYSEPVSIKRDVKFYVTGFSPVGNKAVTLSVFVKKFGNWVKADFDKLTPGQMIGAETMAKVFNPLTGMKEPMVVDFRTGATLLELLTRQTYYRKGRKYTDGVAVVIETADGRLVRRIKEVDSDDPDYKELCDWAKREHLPSPSPDNTGGGMGDMPPMGGEMGEFPMDGE
jgi:hypothetical protein